MTGPNARLGPIVGTAATALAKARGIQTAGNCSSSAHALCQL